MYRRKTRVVMRGMGVEGHCGPTTAVYSPEDRPLVPTACPCSDGILESHAKPLEDGSLPGRGPSYAPSCCLRSHRGGGPADVMFRKEALAVKSPQSGTRKLLHALAGCSGVQAKPEEDRKGRGEASMEAAVELGVAESGVHTAFSLTE